MKTRYANFWRLVLVEQPSIIIGEVLVAKAPHRLDIRRSKPRGVGEIGALGVRLRSPQVVGNLLFQRRVRGNCLKGIGGGACDADVLVIQKPPKNWNCLGIAQATQ